MFSVQPADGYKNLWDLPNLLLQKFPAEEFTVTAKVRVDARFEGERFGLLVMGMDYAYLGVINRGGKLYVLQATAKDADKGSAETESMSQPLASNEVYMRGTVKTGALCGFSYSIDGKTFTSIGEPFKVREGRWIGAKIGFFFNRPAKFNDAGSVDIDWFRFEK
jgi:beta-xylosidase